MAQVRTQAYIATRDVGRGLGHGSGAGHGHGAGAGHGGAGTHTGAGSRVHADVGGRVDVKKEVEGFGVVASVTDQGIRHQSLKDVVVTADRSHGNSNFLVGYDLGLKSVFAQASHVSDIAQKHASAAISWFQHANQVRGEAAVQLSHNAQLWGAHSFNHEGRLGSPTLTTLKERNGFLIAPFTVPIAASAASLTLEHEGVTIQPSYDFNQRTAYLSVGATKNNKRIKASYAFQDEYALLEVSNPGYGGHTDLQTNIIGGKGLLTPGLTSHEHAPPVDQRFAGGMDVNYANNASSSVPYVRGFIKAPVSARGGVGAVTVGAFVDYNFSL